MILLGTSLREIHLSIRAIQIELDRSVEAPQ